MSHRRKRSKGSWTNPVKGAMVINKGGGGGQIPTRKLALELVDAVKAEQKDARSLTAGDNVATIAASFKNKKRKRTNKRSGPATRNLRIVRKETV